MTVDRKDLPEGIVFIPQQPPHKKNEDEMRPGRIGEQRDRMLRHFKAVQLGLDPDATWGDINKNAAEKTQMRAAIKLGLNMDASWEEIKNEDEKKRRA